MEVATGERIVAFGRVGKPPENRFLRRFRVRSDEPRLPKAMVFRNVF